MVPLVSLPTLVFSGNHQPNRARAHAWTLGLNTNLQDSVLYSLGRNMHTSGLQEVIF